MVLLISSTMVCLHDLISSYIKVEQTFGQADIYLTVFLVQFFQAFFMNGDQRFLPLVQNDHKATDAVARLLPRFYPDQHPD